MDYVELIKNFDLTTIITISVIFYTITRGWRNEFRNEMKEWRAEVKEEIACIRKDTEKQTARTDQLQRDFYQRTDKLYEMFVDLLKEIRDNKNNK